MSQLPEEIVSAAGRGWRLLPCVPRDKKPLLKSWPILATCDLGTIQKWAAKHAGCNWAVATGERSGAFVVDVDGQEGCDSLAGLERAHSALPATLVCHTARGRHFWLRYPSDVHVGNSTGKLGPGIDTRGEGGFVLIPPSVHPSGIPYRWADFGQDVAPLPEWLRDLIAASERAPRRHSRPRWPAVDEESTADRGIPVLREGRRNDTLFRLGCAMRRRGASQEQIEAELIEANQRRCVPPLDRGELLTIVQSASRYEPGAGDILDAAKEAIAGQEYRNHAEAFRALCAALQRLRGAWPVALPVERIGQILHCHWTLVARYRRQGVSEGWLLPDEPCIETRRAATFRVILGLSETAGTSKCLTRNRNSESKPVARARPSETPQFSPSETDTPCPSETQTLSLIETAGSLTFPQCRIADDAATLAALPLDPSIFSAGRIQ